jgi:hypothetical protein
MEFHDYAVCLSPKPQCYNNNTGLSFMFRNGNYRLPKWLVVEAGGALLATAMQPASFEAVYDYALHI